MPKRIDQDELKRIVAAVVSRPDGASVAELEPEIGLPRRTLQARLRALVQAGRLALVGRGRAARYRAPADTVPAVGFAPSPEAADILRYVEAPLANRRPVGYEREFLDRYRPNETSYLSSEQRARLAVLGQRGASDQPAGTFARRIMDRLLIDLSWASSRLEGNTYSRLETERLLCEGTGAEGREAFETQMILNHKAAIEYLVDGAGDVAFDRHTILSLHALLSDNLLGDPRAGGRLRSIAVAIGGSVFHPLEAPQLIDEVFEQVVNTAAAIEDPFEQALFALVHIPYLQPFDDVNKRVSRLAANIPLIRRNLCPLSFLDVPTDTYIHAILGVYERNRVELLRDLFVWAYARSADRYAAVRRSLGDPDPFRLRYRDAIQEAVARCVRELATGDIIEAVAVASVAAPDRQQFSQVVRAELAGLHDGNVARYRIRPSELAQWKRATT